MIVIFKVLGVCLLVYLIMLAIGYFVAKGTKITVVTEPEVTNFMPVASTHYKHLLTIGINHHILKVNDETPDSIISRYRKEQNVPQSNVFLYDSDVIVPFIGVYPLSDADSVMLANHLIAGSSFDVLITVAYPLKDWYYRELILKGNNHDV